MRPNDPVYQGNYGYLPSTAKNTTNLCLYDALIKRILRYYQFHLMKDIGDICINQTADKDTIFEMLDFYRECMGI